MRKVLIIEDDESIARLISMTLGGEGYICKCAYDGKAGADLIEAENYDLILLDLMLPEIDGFELLQYIRSLGDTPVIIISARIQVDDRIKGLKMGADDYLPKPFQIGELIARADAVLRRSKGKSGSLTLGDIELDISSRIAKKAGKVIDLTIKEFDLLTVLIQHKNVALSRSFLYESVWNEPYMGDTRTLDSHIQRLRKKLDLNDVIQTVFRIGYRLYIPEKGKQ